MYTFKTSNENIAFSAIYCDCCKHKWTAIKYINKMVNGLKQISINVLIHWMN